MVCGAIWSDSCVVSGASMGYAGFVFDCSCSVSLRIVVGSNRGGDGTIDLLVMIVVGVHVASSNWN